MRGDFKEVFVTTEISRMSFCISWKKQDYLKDELIAVGDDPESEIQAARDLGIKT